MTGALAIGLAGNALSVKNTTNAASVQVAIFEGDRATPAANDEVYTSYYLSDSSGGQGEVGRISVLQSTVTAGAEVSNLDFSIINGGSLSKYARLSTSAFRPYTNNLIALGHPTAGNWADLFLASGGVINWDNGNVTLTHTTDDLTLSGGLIINGSSGDLLRTNPSGTARGVVIRGTGTGKNFLIDYDLTNSNTGDNLFVCQQTSVVTDGGTYTKSHTNFDIFSNVIETSGTITDTAKVFSVRQLNTSASGNVFEIDNYGTGKTLVGRDAGVEAWSITNDGVVNATGEYQVDGTKVVGNRVVDARCDDTINSGDATTDGVIDALRDAMIAHGLIAAA